MTRSTPIPKEKIKAVDIPSFLGFNRETLPHPCNVNINRYAFELFFEYSLRPEITKFSLSSDHIEHGFQIISEKRSQLNELKQIINHLFLFAFTEILFADGCQRSNLFLERQSKNCTLTDDEIRQLVDLDPEMTDSVKSIFEHLVAPIDNIFDPEFFNDINRVFDEDSAPAVSFLLRHFIHDESSHMNYISPYNQLITPEQNTFSKIDSLPHYFTESSSPNIHQRSIPFAEFRMIRQIPTIYISQPKYSPPPLPSLTCIHIPRYAEFAVADITRAAACYSSGSQLFYISQNSNLKELQNTGNNISALAISKCGEWLLSGDINGSILLQHVIKNRSCKYQPTRSLITSMSFAPKLPHQFAVGTLDGSISLYDVSKINILRLFVGHLNSIVAVEIHPNSEYIISTALDGIVRVWSISLAQCVRVFKAAGSIPTLLKISKNGHMVMTAAASGEISISDIAIGKTIKSTKRSEAVICADFSSNDETIAGVDAYGNFLLWESRELQTEPPITVRIERTRILALQFLDSAEVRIIGCQK